MEISDSRLRAAALALDSVLRLAHPADSLMRQHFREHRELGQSDRAFVAEMVFCVLRNKRLLETICGRATPRRLTLAALIRLQGVNLSRLDGLLSRDERDWAEGLKAVQFEALPAAVRLSVPDWLYARLAALMSDTDLFALARGMLAPAPLDIRVNTLKSSREEVLAQLHAEGMRACATPYSPIGVRLEEKPALQKHPLFLSGAIEVQDEGSQLLGYLLAPKRREMVVDFCAGAGGKTLLLGTLMHSQGRLYAFDTSEKRLSNLKPRLARSGLSNVHPQLISSETDAKIKRLAGRIDRVLVDAPCSGLGTLRRNPDLKWRQHESDVVELSAKQTRILASSARLVKAGGRLVYATCSVLPEENRSVVEHFLAGHPEFHLLDCGQLLEKAQIPLQAGAYLELFPHVHGTDGFFAAVMERDEAAA
jgi:16S rRNA (cytosine967-C5)-methyltransferase